MEIDQALDAVRAFVAEREWQPFHDPKNLAMALASEVGELLALYRWVPSAEADDYAKDPARRTRVEEEIADVAIMLHLFCDRVGVDLPEAILAKLEKNRQRYPVLTSRGRAERP